MLGLVKLVGGCAIPVALTIVFGNTGDGMGCGAKPKKSIRPASQTEVYRRIPTEPGILINISRALFPATRDVTLLGQRATPALRRGLLENTDAGVRWKAAQVLTQLRDPAARPDLHAALGDWIPSVRHQALLALAVVGDRSSVPVILKRLADPDETLGNRVAAIRALGRIGDARAAGPIIRQFHKGLPIVRQLQKVHDEPAVRLAAVSALWDLRRVVPRATLGRQIHLALVDPDERVVRRAAIVSGNLRDVTALPYLRKVLLQRSTDLRNVTAYAIGRIGSPRGVRVLEEALPRVRTGRLLNNISFAMKRLGAQGLWRHLQTLLLHKQAFIRLNAAYTAGEMRQPQSRELLEQLLSDPNVMVQAEALVALAKLRVPEAHGALLGFAAKARSGQLRLALRAALFVRPDSKTRDRYLKVTARTSHRRQAGLVFAELGDRRAAPLLYPSISSAADAEVWREVGRLKDPLLRELLAEQLKTALAQGRLALLPQLLTAVGPDGARLQSMPLLRLLFRTWPALSARNPGHAGALLAVLGGLGLSDVDPVRNWIEPYLQHANYWVRMETRLALARLGDDRALQQLVETLATAADHHRQRLARLLGRLPLDRLTRAVGPLLAVDDPYVKLAVGAALYYAGDKKSAPLMAALRSPQASVRARARHYLSTGLDAQAHAVLKQVRKAERDPIARAELDRLLATHEPRPPAFREFIPREVVLF